MKRWIIYFLLAILLIVAVFYYQTHKEELASLFGKTEKGAPEVSFADFSTTSFWIAGFLAGVIILLLIIAFITKKFS